MKYSVFDCHRVTSSYFPHSPFTASLCSALYCTATAVEVLWRKFKFKFKVYWVLELVHSTMSVGLSLILIESSMQCLVFSVQKALFSYKCSLYVL